MNRRRFLAAAAAALLLSACATAPAEPQSAPAFFVMRHLDTPAGERDPDLTARGHARADALARRLEGEGIGAIYVTDYRRTRQTAAPLAERLGLEPVVYDPRDPAPLLELVRATPRPVLVVGHSNTVPDLVAGLGGTRPDPLAHEDFGDLWRIERDGTTRRLRID